mgnify:FL=1
MKKRQGLFFLLAIFFPLALLSQEEPTDTTQLETVQTVEVSNISSISEKDMLWLDQLEQNHTSENAINDLKDSYQRLKKDIEESTSGISKGVYEKLSYRKLENLSREWERLNSQLNEFLDKINPYSQKIDSDLDRINTLQEKWQTTVNELRQNNTSNTIINRIEIVLNASEQSKSFLNTKFNQSLKLQDDASQLALRLTQKIQNLSTEIIRRDQALLTRDTPPIWRKDRFDFSQVSIKSIILSSIDEIRDSFKIFLKEYTRAFIIHLIVTLLLWALVYTARKELANGLKKDEEETRRYKKLLFPSINSTLIISFSLVNFIYPNAPLFIYEIASIIVLIPLIYEYSELVSSRIFKISLIFAVLYVIETTHNILFNYTELNWLSGLVVSFLALLLFVHFIRSRIFYEQKEISKSPIYPYVRFFIRFFTVLLAGSILANLTGYYNLSNRLNISTIESVYLGILLYTIANILQALLYSLVYSRFGQQYSSIIRLNADAIIKKIPRYINFIMVIVWIVISMKFYSIYTPVKESVLEFLSKSHEIGSINISLGNILIFFLITYLTAWLVKILRIVMEQEVMPRYTLPRGMPTAISLMIRISLYSIGFLIALAATGIELEKISILLGALGVGIGFGLQNIFNNLVSGLILVFERPIQQGDVVQLGDLLGHVKEIGFRSSRIRTFEGSEVIVPNGNLISNELINWTLSDKQKRLEVIVGVAYGTDPHKVIKIITEESILHPDVLSIPKPIGLFTGFGDSSLDFRLLFWTTHFDDWLRIRSEVTLLVHDAIKREGIEIPFPQRDLHVRSVQIPNIPIRMDEPGKTDNDKKNK